MAACDRTSKVKVSVWAASISMRSWASDVTRRGLALARVAVPKTGMALLRGHGLAQPGAGGSFGLEGRHHLLGEQAKRGQHLFLRHRLQGVEQEVDAVDAGGFPALQHFDDVLRIA